ncbi:pyridoxamine 5'-phosphate oxidase family protein [uncultured Jatrophihabitans sp.]|uniref:pyridoxamine 5'-phosphate oxidase family protein n=1 Tax=uncultured Jatrophihabitans sp. TaxID=1610747 RepID=UPI0035CC40A0
MSERTRITRLREKGSTDRAQLDALLDDARVGHFAIAADDAGPDRADRAPVVLPTAITRDGDRVLAHGSTGSRWMRALAQGAPTCLAVTELDGLVVARSAFESSLHYRSAVLFGRCVVVPAAEKTRALDLITEALLPGRTAEVRRPTGRELDATLVLALPIVEWSLKISAGWPEDPAEDVAGPAWAGVVPIRGGYGDPQPAPDLQTGRTVPESVRRLPLDAKSR